MVLITLFCNFYRMQRAARPLVYQTEQQNLKDDVPQAPDIASLYTLFKVSLGTNFLEYLISIIRVTFNALCMVFPFMLTIYVYS